MNSRSAKVENKVNGTNLRDGAGMGDEIEDAETADKTKREVWNNDRVR